MSPRETRERLREGARGALVGDAAAMVQVTAWLEGVSARELLRVDGYARQFRYEGPVLGGSQEWTREVLERSTTAAALACMHPDGRVRERALRMLARSDSSLSDRMIAVRVGDHVAAVSTLASQAVLSRTSPVHAAAILPILQRHQSRHRAADSGDVYLETLVRAYGADQTWEALRCSADRDLRRFAFRRSVELGMLDSVAAADLLPRERDQVVRSVLTHVIADQADPPTIRAVLLRARSAESRVLGLLRLHASDLEAGDVAPLLVDSSVLVRLWARRRWQELGQDPTQAYRDLIRSAPTPTKQARAYVGLAESGSAIERVEVLGLVHATEPALQKVGLRLLVGHATPADVPNLLALVRSPHSGIARLAGTVLAAHPHLWALDQIADLKSHADSEIRRRAWWLHRGRGGWESLIADLELLHDPEPSLAALGRQPSAPMYFEPTDVQRERITGLLPDATISREQKLGIALAAGLPDVVDMLRARPPRPPAEPTPTETTLEQPRWWQRIRLPRRRT